jgi:hypothetical protein
MNHIKLPARLFFISLASFVLTLTSSFIHQNGPETAQYSNLCEITGDNSCHELIIKGGFPIPYLFDKPGVSIEHQISIFEDDFLIDKFLIDLLIINTVIFILFELMKNKSKCRDF